jgi:hypothetical protein
VITLPIIFVLEASSLITDVITVPYFAALIYACIHCRDIVCCLFILYEFIYHVHLVAYLLSYHCKVGVYFVPHEKLVASCLLVKNSCVQQ